MAANSRLKWTETIRDITIQDFVSPTGPPSSNKEFVDSTPLASDIFRKFFDDAFLLQVIAFTKDYSHLKECDVILSIEELLAFIGCLLLMGDGQDEECDRLFF